MISIKGVGHENQGRVTPQRQWQVRRHIAAVLFTVSHMYFVFGNVRICIFKLMFSKWFLLSFSTGRDRVFTSQSSHDMEKLTWMAQCTEHSAQPVSWSWYILLTCRLDRELQSTIMHWIDRDICNASLLPCICVCICLFVYLCFVFVYHSASWIDRDMRGPAASVAAAIHPTNSGMQRRTLFAHFAHCALTLAHSHFVCDIHKKLCYRLYNWNTAPCNNDIATYNFHRKNFAAFMRFLFLHLFSCTKL